MNRPRSVFAVAAIGSAFVLAVPMTATASPVVSDPIVSGLAGPLQLDVGEHGLYVSQSFAGVITKIRANGTTKDLVAEPGDVAGIASDGYDIVYTFTGGDETNPIAQLKIRRANGHVRVIADLYKFEKTHNPDSSAEYGFRNLTKKCAARVPPEVGGEPYGGLIDSHPYAVANASQGGWYVADAGGNDILYVSPKGHIEVVNVPRPQKAPITAEAAEANGLPKCTIGKLYAFEPVPTDVEVSPLGYLMVSLLPGGPEDASLGARGAVMRIDPGDGEWSVIGRGFLGATNLAVAPGGKIYVAELFGNRISLLQNHVVTPLVDVNEPGAVEYTDGKLYATIDVFGNGSVVSITL